MSLLSRWLRLPPKSKPKFCRHCGHKLEPNTSISEYNEETGEPIRPYLHQMVCPNKYYHTNYNW